MNDMSKWDDLFGGDRGPDGERMHEVERDSIVNWPIAIETAVDPETGKTSIIVDRCDIIRVEQGQVGLALEVAWAMVRRMRAYRTESQP